MRSLHVTILINTYEASTVYLLTGKLAIEASIISDTHTLYTYTQAKHSITNIYNGQVLHVVSDHKLQVTRVLLKVNMLLHLRI